MKTTIGVYSYEKHILQTLIIDLSLKVDIVQSAKTDRLDDTCDYDTLCQQVSTLIERKSYNLIETVGYDISKFLDQEEKIMDYTIKVSKPSALKHAQNVAICLSKPKGQNHSTEKKR